MIDLEKTALPLDIGIEFHYNTLEIGVWRSLVSRLVRVQEASGSNPDTPTIEKHRNRKVSVLFLTFALKNLLHLSHYLPLIYH